MANEKSARTCLKNGLKTEKSKTIQPLYNPCQCKDCQWLKQQKTWCYQKTLQNLQNEHPAVEKAIKTGRLSVVAMCQNKLMEKVSSGDTTAIIYALKVYGGDFFNDRKAVEAKITGTPISVKPQVQVYLPATDVIEAGEDNEKK